jgi:hypothetical protein
MEQAVSITSMTYTYCCVYSTRLLIWTENLSETVDFHSKRKFKKLVNHFGFIIRIHHDARSYECQISTYINKDPVDFRVKTKVSELVQAFPSQ